MNAQLLCVKNGLQGHKSISRLSKEGRYILLTLSPWTTMTDY